MAGVCTRYPPIINCTGMECPKGMSCLDDECIQTTDPNPPKNRSCIYSLQCKPRGKLVCYQSRCITNAIVYPLCVDTCPDHPDEECINSVCQPKSPGCKTDADCKDPSKPRCFRSKCRLVPDIGCESNSDCPPHMPSCIDGTCYMLIPIQCEKDVDCGNPSQMTCLNNLCRNRPPTPVVPIPECENNFFCPPEKVCMDGKCANKPKNSCTLRENCKKKMVCYKSVCKIGVELGCASDTDCPPETPYCSEGFCLEEKQRKCNRNIDCFSKKPICYNSICVDTNPVCVNDEDCPREKDKCVGGECQSSIPPSPLPLEPICDKVYIQYSIHTTSCLLYTLQL